MKPDSFPPSTLSSDSLPNDFDLSKQLALTIAQTADDRKGKDILLLDVADVSFLADYFVLVTGFSKTQVRTLAQTIEAAVAEKWHRQPLRSEGEAGSTWIVKDYGEVIVHVMMPEEREFYNLEAFWGHAEQISFSSEMNG